MTVKYNIDPEHKDHRHQHAGTLLQDDIIFRLKVSVIGLRHHLLQLFIFTVPIQTQKKKHTAGTNKQHAGLAKGIKGSIVQDHARDDIDCPCLLKPPFDIPGRHLIVIRIVSVSSGRQSRHGP